MLSTFDKLCIFTLYFIASFSNVSVIVTALYYVILIKKNKSSIGNWI